MIGQEWLETSRITPALGIALGLRNSGRRNSQTSRPKPSLTASESSSNASSRSRDGQSSGSLYTLAPSVCAAMLLSGQVTAGDGVTPLAWLDKMAHAAQMQNYDGTFVYQDGLSMGTMRIIHRYDEGHGVRERLVSLTGTGGEILRDGERLVCILPENGQMVTSKSRRQMPTSAPFVRPGEGFDRYYDLSTEVGGRVAGRETQIVQILPGDEYRYGYRLALDSATGLLLKSELLAGTEQTLETLEFTTLSLPKEISLELVSPDTADQQVRLLEPNQQDSGQAAATFGDSDDAWLISDPPVGFEITARTRTPKALAGEYLLQYVLSDGLASVSVFIEKLHDPSSRMEGLSRMGAINAYGATVQDFQVTAVGEVPAEAVMRIGKSVRMKVH